MGCGTGSTALELAPGVAEYPGTDFSAEMIDIARSKLSDDLPANLAFEVAPANEIPTGNYDAILALNLFHLVKDLEVVLANIYDALPSGGLLIDKTALLKDGKWFIRPMIPVMQFFGKAPYCRSMTGAEYRSLLRRVGFEPVEEILQPGMAHGCSQSLANPSDLCTTQTLNLRHWVAHCPMTEVLKPRIWNANLGAGCALASPTGSPSLLCSHRNKGGQHSSVFRC